MTTRLFNNQFVIPSKFSLDKIPELKIVLSHPLYDGVRFLAGLDGDQVVIHSESSQCVNSVSVVKKCLLPVLKRLECRYPSYPIVIEGVFLDVKEEERMSSKREPGLVDDAIAVILDVSLPESYMERYEILREYINLRPDQEVPIKLVRCVTHHSMWGLDETYKWYVANGYRKICVRDPDGPYISGRTNSVMIYHGEKITR